VATEFPRYVPRRGPGILKVPDALRGENHFAAKMSQADVDELRSDRASGMSVEECFLKWHSRRGISYANVRKILAHMSWK
jgi:hypothetical protein